MEGLLYKQAWGSGKGDISPALMEFMVYQGDSRYINNSQAWKYRL